MNTYENLKNKKKDELIEIILRETNPKATSVPEAVENLQSIKIDHNQENFIILGLNTSNQIIKKKVLFKGGMSSCTIDPKIVFKELLNTNRCTRFIIAHNHPSGLLTPSDADREMTRKLKKGAKLLAMSLLDHIIFNEVNYYSFLEENQF